LFKGDVPLPSDRLIRGVTELHELTGHIAECTHSVRPACMYAHACLGHIQLNPIVGIATANSGIQAVARSPIFARTQLALHQGSCAEVGSLFVCL
jgi:hypothetical protein